MLNAKNVVFLFAENVQCSIAPQHCNKCEPLGLRFVWCVGRADQIDQFRNIHPKRIAVAKIEPSHVCTLCISFSIVSFPPYTEYERCNCNVNKHKAANACMMNYLAYEMGNQALFSVGVVVAVWREHTHFWNTNTENLHKRDRIRAHLQPTCCSSRFLFLSLLLLLLLLFISSDICHATLSHIFPVRYWVYASFFRSVSAAGFCVPMVLVFSLKLHVLVTQNVCDDFIFHEENIIHIELFFLCTMFDEEFVSALLTHSFHFIYFRTCLWIISISLRREC